MTNFPENASQRPVNVALKKPTWSWQTMVSGGALVSSVLAIGLVLTQPYWLASSEPQAHLIPNAPEFSTVARTSPTDAHLFSTSSSLIADVAEDIAPSVVNIDVARRARYSNAQVPFMMDQDMFERFFGVRPMMPPQLQRQAPVAKGTGSGLIISADGRILTNNHVIEGADEIMVTLKDGRKLKATVAGRDPMTDLAILKVSAPNLKPAKLGNSSVLRPGEWVIAVGSPLGFDHTVTLGIVSALSRQVPDINTNVDFIQTDAAINPGNSGGPLVNLNGEVIGINTAISGSGQNIGFAIPINVVKNITTDLANGGQVNRPWIGITMAELNPNLAQSLGLPPTTAGVVVAQVMPNSPSYRAGFQEGDIIQRINGQAMANPKSIQDFIRSKPINSQLSIQIIRNGQMQALSLKTETLPLEAQMQMH